MAEKDGQGLCLIVGVHAAPDILDRGDWAGATAQGRGRHELFGFLAAAARKM